MTLWLNIAGVVLAGMLALYAGFCYEWMRSAKRRTAEAENVIRQLAWIAGYDLSTRLEIYEKRYGVKLHAEPIESPAPTGRHHRPAQ